MNSTEQLAHRLNEDLRLKNPDVCPTNLCNHKKPAHEYVTLRYYRDDKRLWYREAICKLCDKYTKYQVDRPLKEWVNVVWPNDVEGEF